MGNQSQKRIEKAIRSQNVIKEVRMKKVEIHRDGLGKGNHVFIVVWDEDEDEKEFLKVHLGIADGRSSGYSSSYNICECLEAKAERKEKTLDLISSKRGIGKTTLSYDSIEALTEYYGVLMKERKIITNCRTFVIEFSELLRQLEPEKYHSDGNSELNNLGAVFGNTRTEGAAIGLGAGGAIVGGAGVAVLVTTWYTGVGALAGLIMMAGGTAAVVGAGGAVGGAVVATRGGIKEKIGKKRARMNE